MPEVVTAYGMTEVNIPLYGRLGGRGPGTAGLVLDRWFEVEVRDPDTDAPVPRGNRRGDHGPTRGCRSASSPATTGCPRRRSPAWRSFWFHTGDSGVMDAEGWVTFVDRTKD